MKRYAWLALLLAAALVVSLGCKKDEEPDVATGGGPGPMMGGKGPGKAPPVEETEVGGDLPAIGETLTISMMGETETITVSELDTDALDAMGVPAYPGAVGGTPSTGADEGVIGMITADDKDKVVAWYEEQLGEGYVDQAAMLVGMMESMNEMASKMGEGAEGMEMPEGPSEEEMELIKSMSMLVNPEGKGVIILPLPDEGYTVIVAGAQMGGMMGGPPPGDMGGMPEGPDMGDEGADPLAVE